MSPGSDVDEHACASHLAVPFLLTDRFCSLGVGALIRLRYLIRAHSYGRAGGVREVSVAFISRSEPADLPYPWVQSGSAAADEVLGRAGLLVVATSAGNRWSRMRCGARW